MLIENFGEFEKAAAVSTERVRQHFDRSFDQVQEIAASAVGGAGSAAKTSPGAPRQKSRSRKAVQPEASMTPAPGGTAPRAPNSRSGARSQASKRSKARSPMPATTPSATGGADEGHILGAAQIYSALIGEISETKRRYDDLRQAHQRVLLQAMSVCRRVSGGDKEAGAKLYRAPTPEVMAWLAPYHAAMEPLVQAIAIEEKKLAMLGGQLPVAGWAAGVPGLSTRFLAMIVGECAARALDDADRLIGPGEFKTVSALWKHMGLAVFDGERQRRVAGDAAILQGYVPRRRSLMWNIGESILKQQIRNPKDGERHAVGPYGQLYIDRRAHEIAAGVERDCIIHARAKRFIEKRLLRDLWAAWRRA